MTAFGEPPRRADIGKRYLAMLQDIGLGPLDDGTGHQ